MFCSPFHFVPFPLSLRPATPTASELNRKMRKSNLRSVALLCIQLPIVCIYIAFWVDFGKGRFRYSGGFGMQAFLLGGHIVMKCDTKRSRIAALMGWSLRHSPFQFKCSGVIAV